MSNEIEQLRAEVERLRAENAAQSAALELANGALSGLCDGSENSLRQYWDAFGIGEKALAAINALPTPLPDPRDAALELAKVAIQRVINDSSSHDCFYPSYLDEALAAIEALPAADPWLPIETAPKDGTRFLGAVKYGSQFVCWFSELRGCWVSESHIGEVPFSWMPLPAAPKGGA